MSTTPGGPPASYSAHRLLSEIQITLMSRGLPASIPPRDLRKAEAAVTILLLCCGVDPDEHGRGNRK
jgi:hypothetical protein